MEEESWDGGAFGVVVSVAKDVRAEATPRGDHAFGKKKGENAFFGDFLFHFARGFGSVLRVPEQNKFRKANSERGESGLTSGGCKCHDNHITKDGDRNESRHDTTGQIATKYCAEEDGGHIQLTVLFNETQIGNDSFDVAKIIFVNRVFDRQALDG